MNDESYRPNTLTMELRRGVLVMAALKALRTPHYGYSLRRFLDDRGLEVDEGTLYPLLRRLEAQGLLISDWKIQEGRKRRVYQLSAEGATTHRLMVEEWQLLNDALNNIPENTP